MKIVPLHCLVIILGGNPDDRARHHGVFPDHEVVTEEKLLNQLTGGHLREGTDEILLSELSRTVQVKLKLGERIVVDMAMSKPQRLALVNSARNHGVPVFYLITNDLDRDTGRGDGMAEVINVKDEDVCPVPPQRLIDIDFIRARYVGISAIGDIHGMQQNFHSALSWARSRGHFPVILGDIIDYGPASLDVADEVYRLVMRGEAKLILGNHERKIMRWLDGKRVRLSDGNKVTTRALHQLGETLSNRWSGRFRGLYQNSRLIDTMSNVTFVHGAVHPDYWNDESSPVIENTAFFGETVATPRTSDRSERPTRSYRWIESIPSDRIVVSGHDWRAEYPMTETNSQGGKAVFLDTGSGKGGSLSLADFRFEETGKLNLENSFMI